MTIVAATRADIICIQEAVCGTLVIKCKRALEQTGMKRIVIAGGVSANKQHVLSLEALATCRKLVARLPRTEFCTDNGAMIAYAGMQRLKNGETTDLSVQATPRWPIDQLRTNCVIHQNVSSAVA